MQDEHGRIILQSGVEFPQYMYRGQTKEYVPCVPTLGRLKGNEKKLLALCRNVAFEDAICEHPFVRVCEQVRFLGLPLQIDKQGLAQHYGLATDMLDITSNFDVASFFATNYWNNASQSYQPVCSSNKRGVIYKINTVALMSGNISIPPKLGIVGWQPLSRPEQQRASVIKLDRGEDLLDLLKDQPIKFHQYKQTSTRIWKEFDKGKRLFPKDPAAEVAEQAQVLKRFTRQQVNRAWSRLEKWNDKKFAPSQRQKVEDNIGIVISTKNTLNWGAFDMERNVNKLKDKLQKILYRVKHRETVL